MRPKIAPLMLAAAVGGVAIAQEVPLRNWAVPSQGSGHLSTLGDVNAPSIFVAVSPCRVADTRGNGFTGAYGPPMLSAGVPRTFNIVASSCTGIPAYVSAFSVNLTAVNATGNGMLLAWPAGGSQPSISVLNYVTGQTVANAAIVPAGSGTSITIAAGVHSTNLIIDINGYFTTWLNSGEQLAVASYNSTGASIVGYNYSGVSGTAGVAGRAVGPGTVDGVQGRVDASADHGSSGVHGMAPASATRTSGVFGESQGTYWHSAGVLGIEWADSENVYGVWGFVTSTTGSAAGVCGQADNAASSAGYFENSGMNHGIYTYLGTGNIAWGPPGLYGLWTAGGSIYTDSAIYASVKNFAAPHPSDPSKEIVYTSVEAPSADIYFRGTTELVNGRATIDVPEHFRVSARPDTYETNITAVGAGSVWIEAEGPDGIVVRGTARSVHYFVYAERDAIDRQVPVRENMHFDARALARGDVRALPEGYRKLLVQNGTLNPDLTLNRRTAERLGWEIPAPRAPVDLRKLEGAGGGGAARHYYGEQ